MKSSSCCETSKAESYLFIYHFKGEDLEDELEKATHWMQFAAAAYGWPLYIYSNLFTGPCKLSGDW